MEIKITGKDRTVEAVVSGQKGAEVAEVAASILGEARSAGIEVNVTGSQLGVLNVGEMEVVGGIYANASALGKEDASGVADALKRLTEAVVQQGNIHEQERSALLEQLGKIAEQAKLAPQQRERPAIIKAIMDGLRSGLSVAKDLATVWSTWEPIIVRHFGL
jgi:hypothetical protein